MRAHVRGRWNEATTPLTAIQLHADERILASRGMTRRISLPLAAHHPAYVVWELTLACDQPCTHCGSRAGDARTNELSTEEALRVVGELAALGTKEVVLIGGEAYLHPGFLAIVAAFREAGVRPIMTTGGRGITRELARAMAEAGLAQVSVSIDGLEKTHDLMRAARGSFASATAALGHCQDAGMVIAANTNVNRLNEGDLEALYEDIQGRGVVAWQVQLTTPLGRAADRPDLILQPWDLLRVVPRIAALKERAWKDGILLMPGNNLGYFGPEEATLRSLAPGDSDHWQGCQAGRFVMGIESDGAVKGCPSLQTASYVRGHLRSAPLSETWPKLGVTRELWGFCATCDFAAVCRGGCTFTAHAFFGRPGNNPYCHYRAQVMQRAGLRERLVLRAPAPGDPFDHALFDLVVENFNQLDERVMAEKNRPRDLVRIRRKP